MEIKCNFNPHYSDYSHRYHRTGDVSFKGRVYVPVREVKKSVDIFVRRPVEQKSATGLLGLINKFKQYAHNYTENIRHTVDHKMVYALVEKEVFGKNSINSLTHDSDKMIMYLLGFPRSFVSKVHRKISQHHPESGKKMNLRSMLCDNIASSPEFKPEKKLSLRAYYNSNKQIQGIEGFKDILEKYNYGENLDFNKIKEIKDSNLENAKGVASLALKGFIGVFIGSRI